MALDQATTALLSQMAELGVGPLHDMSPHQARELVSAMTGMFGVGPEVSRVYELDVPVGDGHTIATRVYVPTESSNVRAAIVYYHGGGWVVGAIAEYDVLARQLAQRSGAMVFVVDYRLAPEHRFPTAIEDAWAAVTFISAHLQAEHIEVPLVVMGDSAGGNLAAVVARRGAASGLPRLAAQVLIYPVTDADFNTASYLDEANQLILNRNAMVWFWNHYAPNQSVRTHPDASPLHAADLSGVPPAVILTAEHDPLRDEGEAYAERLQEADVPVVHARFAGQMHGFFTMPNVLPGADSGMDFVVKHLEAHLALRHQLRNGRDDS